MAKPLFDEAASFEASLSNLLTILSVLEISIIKKINFNFNSPSKWQEFQNLKRAFQSFTRIWEIYAYQPDDRRVIDKCEELLYELKSRFRETYTSSAKLRANVEKILEEIRGNLQFVLQWVIMMSYDGPDYSNIAKFVDTNRHWIIVDELAKIRLAELAKQMDDFRTVHPDTSRISALETKNFITQLTDNLFNKVPHEQCNDQTKDRTSEILPELLEAFALKIGHSSPSQMHRNAMYFIHKHRQ